MKQLYKEEAEDEEEVEEKVHQVPPKTPRKRVQKNHPSDQITGNKDVGLETRRKIRSPEQTHLALSSTIEPTFLKRPTRMNFGTEPWMKNWIN